ncbi:alkaline phosphatase [Shewanella nanhaiensis]|uniref:Alkaline phosphatase n=1 Tax=Shewanella nanhaiensis TaxID=2864872 RepID=A0ABS7E791_9GAMM|nr:alkaline phosphatase [Shewanella nanhaiensis]MBW8185218.1 alkaline phosphatase [Shewanella nanhaiensis]
MIITKYKRLIILGTWAILTACGGGDTDITAPVITLNGDTNIVLFRGENYSELGASAYDERDGNVDVIISGSVNVNIVGSYKITYTAADNAGNSSNTTRTIEVVLPPDTTAPVITLNGHTNIILILGESYTELGASAIDDRDGFVDVVISGTVDTNKVGNYTITYSATDNSNNNSLVTRTIEVVLPQNPKNVILLIGDGMGGEHRKAAQWLSVGINGKLSMDNMPVSGFLQTESANNATTDSAAAATAMATGVKTNNGVISLDASLNFVSTILEEAKSNGKSVGLITTTQITHATPAAFASHVESRYLMTEIAEQITTAGVNVLFGGGEDEFIPASDIGCFPEPGERSDGRNLIDELESSGYEYVCDQDSFDILNPDINNFVLGLFADEGMARPFSPTLASMTSKAIDILSKNPDGFFLMIEGGQIDWASHSNDAANAIADTVAFDEAVEIAKKFASLKNDTLIIVTADHETGGMEVSTSSSGLADEDGPYNIKGGGLFYINWSTTSHTPANVPVTALGPKSDMLTGTNSNTIIHEVISSMF